MATTGGLSEAEVAAWRVRFPILRRCVYLVNNSLGAMPASVSDALREYTDLWATSGVEAWGEWLPEVRRVADLLAALLGAPPGSVVVHQNVATLTAMVCSGLDWSGRRRKVVLAADEWPSHHYLLAEHRRAGAEVVASPAGVDAGDVGPVVEAVDDATALVVSSHVDFRTGALRDVAAVAERARRVGALSLVDGYHAVGAIPVDVAALGCDLYTGGSVKWLCGGPGVGYLYVRPGLDERLAPAAVGWLGHARPFAFEPGWEPAPGAMGWLGGTPSVPALYAAREGYRVIAEVGPARIRATTAALTARLVEGAQERGHVVRTPRDPRRRVGTVTIDLGAHSEAVSRRLLDAGVLIDYRPDAGIRVGPHFFNTVEECDVLLDALDG